MQLAVEPDVGRPLDHEDELLLRALRVRIRRPPPRRQPLVMDAEPLQPEVPPERRPDAHELVVAAIAAASRRARSRSSARCSPVARPVP